MKKVISFILITLLLFTITSVSTQLTAIAAINNIKGDYDNDGVITVADALIALRIAAKLAPETSELITIGDYDSDGRITVADALIILRIAAKLTTNQEHTHSYITTVVNPTCSSEGYTEHKCNCGDVYYSDYTQPTPHQYINYCCHDCGFVDNSHPYEGLKEWVMTCGEVSGEHVNIDIHDDNWLLSISYNANSDYLYVSSLCVGEDSINRSDDTYCGIRLLCENGQYNYGFFYGYGANEIYINGYINPESFSDNSPITYQTYTGDTSIKARIVEIARLQLVLTLTFFEDFLNQCVEGLCIYDFGFNYSFL